MEGLKIISMYQNGVGEIQFDGRLPSTAESVAWLTKHWGINVELEYPASGAMAPTPPAPEKEPEEVELPVGATEEKPKRGRGRKAAKEAKPEEEKPAEEKPKRGRGRKVAKPKVSEQTSNAELAKAMSQAAGKVGPEEAMAVLAEFKVERVSEIPQEDREDFLQTLRILCSG